jgi:hypothetical protein
MIGLGLVGAVCGARGEGGARLGKCVLGGMLAGWSSEPMWESAKGGVDSNEGWRLIGLGAVRFSVEWVGWCAVRWSRVGEDVCGAGCFPDGHAS